MRLQSGLEHVLGITVTEELTPPHLLPTVVLSTPKMIEVMENACLLAAQSALDDSHTTVGIHVDVSHESAARDGDEVTIRGRLEEVDGGRLTFSVSAMVGDRVIGRGTHRRQVVNRARFSGPPRP